MIRACRSSDAARICEIYNHYVLETVVTFEEAPVAAADMAGRIGNIVASFPWLVWEEGGAVGGFAYAGPWHARSAYRYSVESTIYLAPDRAGRGIGTQLYAALLSDLGARGLRCAIAGIALPNAASVRLHEKLGFTKVGQLAEVGWKFERWIDVGYWELIL